MSIRNFSKICNANILRNSIKTDLAQCKHYSKGRCVISAKRNAFNFHEGQTYNKLDEVKLASKGWTNNQSKGDFFVIHPDPTQIDEPKFGFDELGVPRAVVEVLRGQGIEKATFFQSEVLPVLRDGNHTLMAAETGCGKTIAYIIPLIEKIMSNPTEELNTPQVLVLVPNRELAHQVSKVAEPLANAVGLKVKSLVGGGTKRIMMNPEFSQIDILVATPGAMGKLSTVGVYKLHKVLHTVLDEADTLLDDSFVDRIEMLMKRVPQSQIVMCSATMPKRLPAVMEPIRDSLVHVCSERLHRPLMNVTQRFLRLAKSSRPFQLLELAKQTKQPFIAFTNRNETSKWLAMFLRENGLKCSNINGDMNYHVRVEQWQDFVDGHTNILSATDVGSRGLDTTQVKHVLNYDFPLYAADYIHRVGRVGRLGSVEMSKVTNFVSGMREIKLVQDIEMAIRTGTEIRNVDGNITNIVQNKIMQKMREAR